MLDVDTARTDAFQSVPFIRVSAYAFVTASCAAIGSASHVIL
jgi:hypothetical protein